MKILGIILELNPFHNGHKYFINKAIDEVKPDLVIGIISTSFTMRGEISVIDKFEKTKLCLENNIDIVLELPFIFTLNSSDFFAYYSIKILNEFKITDLAFGIEADNISILNEINEICSSSDFNNIVKNNLDKGLSYPSSSLKALISLTDKKELIDSYTLPNNTLALSYLKAIKRINSSINIHAIKRIDNQYYDNTAILGKLASATSLRSLINKNQSISPFIPNYKYDFVNTDIVNNKILYLLKYNLIKENIKNIFSVEEGIENRFLSFINTENYDEFIKNVQTKRYPTNRIQRIILHIIMKSEKPNDVNYLRVLGLNDKGLKYIKKLNNNTIILNTKKTLDGDNIEIKKILLSELNVSKIYDLITNKDTYKKEYILQVKKNDN